MPTHPTDRDGYLVRPVGRVESPLAQREQAPRQGDEGAPDAGLVFDPEVADAVRELSAGSEMLVLTWLDRADRRVLGVHPRGRPVAASTPSL